MEQTGEKEGVPVKYRIAELRYKEVIDIASGSRYGFVDDIEFDPDTGTVQSIILSGRLRLFGLLGREPDLVFPWSSVKRFGEDIILVESAGQRRLYEGAPPRR